MVWSIFYIFRAMKVFLRATYLGRSIYTNRMIEWPPRSLNLSPQDLFTWVYLKESAYQLNWERATNHDELREKSSNCVYYIFGNCWAQQDLSLYFIKFILFFFFTIKICCLFFRMNSYL